MGLQGIAWESEELDGTAFYEIQSAIYELELEESYSHQRAISFLLVIYIRKSSSLQVCYFMMY